MNDSKMPTQSDWKEAIEAVQSMTPKGIQPVKFEHLVLATQRSPQLLIEHAIDPTYASTAKIIFHFRNIAINDMQIIGKALFELVSKLDIKTASASGSANPEFRNCWDFIYFEVPLMRAQSVRLQIIQVIKDTLK